MPKRVPIHQHGEGRSPISPFITSETSLEHMAGPPSEYVRSARCNRVLLSIGRWTEWFVQTTVELQGSAGIESGARRIEGFDQDVQASRIAVAPRLNLDAL